MSHISPTKQKLLQPLYSPHPVVSLGGGNPVPRNDNGDAQFRGSDLAPELLALGSALAGRDNNLEFLEGMIF